MYTHSAQQKKQQQKTWKSKFINFEWISNNKNWIIIIKTKTKILLPSVINLKMNENHVVNNNKYIFWYKLIFLFYILSDEYTKIKRECKFIFFSFNNFNMIKFTPVLIINYKEKHLERKKN